MNLLNLSLDQQLLSANKQGDTLKRFRAYSRYCQRFDVIVPTTQKSSPDKKSVSSRITIHKAYGSSKLLAYFKLISLTRIICRRHQIDLIVTNDPVTGFVATLAAIDLKPKVQINVYGLQLTKIRWLLAKPHHPLLALTHLWSIYWADSIRTDTKRDARELINIFKINPRKIITLPVPPSSVSQKLLKKQKQDSRFRRQLLKQKKYLVLSVGTLTDNKDFNNLITAAYIISIHRHDAMFVIVGDGPLKSSLHQLVDQFKLTDQILFFGPATYPQLMKLYKAADVLVSSSFIEGLPRVLMEAALAKLPIVTTNTSGAADLIIHKKSGLIVPIGDPQSLANAIEFSLSHPQTARKFAQNAYQHAVKYLSFDANVQKLAANWQKITSN